MEDFAKIYVPLISALISLVSVSIAFLSLRHTRNDRLAERKAAAEAALQRSKELEEQQRAAAADSLRRQQEALFAALQGEKEVVGFMALQISREPHLVTESNSPRLFSALCLAFVFESSSRARALVLKTLRQFSKDSKSHKVILSILDEIRDDFTAYDAEIDRDELHDYLDRIGKLKKSLQDHADTV